MAGRSAEENGKLARNAQRPGRRMVGFKGKNMFYTYILQSITNPGMLYRGHTSTLKKRLAEHNAGKCASTSKHVPWKVKFYAAFETLDLARQFERYLKTGSGHSFSKRHLGL